METVDEEGHELLRVVLLVARELRRELPDLVLERARRDHRHGRRAPRRRAARLGVGVVGVGGGGGGLAGVEGGGEIALEPVNVM